MSIKDYEKFKSLDFERFKKMAQDSSLSRYEKIGFPNSYRAGFEEKIFADIRNKLTNLNKSNQIIVDIGPGCSELPFMLIDLCRQKNHSLILIDSKEVLNHLPDEKFITKVPGRYPQECEKLLTNYFQKADAILTYSVFHYIFTEGNIFEFVDKSLTLLADRGEMLIGDIPNISKRKRFFSSAAGIKHHQEYTGTTDLPEVKFNTIDAEQIDDAVLLSLMSRYRNAGFDAYTLPQADDLPMANRREDLLIRKL